MLPPGTFGRAARWKRDAKGRKGMDAADRTRGRREDAGPARVGYARTCLAMGKKSGGTSRLQVSQWRREGPSGAILGDEPPQHALKANFSDRRRQATAKSPSQVHGVTVCLLRHCQALILSLSLPKLVEDSLSSLIDQPHLLHIMLRILLH